MDKQKVIMILDKLKTFLGGNYEKYNIKSEKCIFSEKYIKTLKSNHWQYISNRAFGDEEKYQRAPMFVQMINECLKELKKEE